MYLVTAVPCSYKKYSMYSKYYKRSPYYQQQYQQQHCRQKSYILIISQMYKSLNVMINWKQNIISGKMTSQILTIHQITSSSTNSVTVVVIVTSTTTSSISIKRKPNNKQMNISATKLTTTTVLTFYFYNLKQDENAQQVSLSAISISRIIVVFTVHFPVPDVLIQQIFFRMQMSEFQKLRSSKLLLLHYYLYQYYSNRTSKQ